MTSAQTGSTGEVVQVVRTTDFTIGPRKSQEGVAKLTGWSNGPIANRLVRIDDKKKESATLYTYLKYLKNTNYDWTIGPRGEKSGRRLAVLGGPIAKSVVRTTWTTRPLAGRVRSVPVSLRSTFDKTPCGLHVSPSPEVSIVLHLRTDTFNSQEVVQLGIETARTAQEQAKEARTVGPLSNLLFCAVSRKSVGETSDAPHSGSVTSQGVGLSGKTTTMHARDTTNAEQTTNASPTAATSEVIA